MLVGREMELERIAGLVEAAEAGSGGALVVRGEAGVGKSSLLEQARALASSTVVSTTGVEAESELPFAGLADILRPLAPSLDLLASTQAEALRGLLGLTAPRPVDRLTLGAATLTLLAECAPLLVLVDDAHWLDQGSQDALLFAARRLAADAVAVLFAARDGETVSFEAAGIAELKLSGLSVDVGLALLAGRVPSSRVARELVERTGGNPLALVELPAALSSAQLLGTEPLEEPLRVSAALERGFSRRVEILGEDARFAVLVAAADSSGDVAVIDAAVGESQLERAEDAGLLVRREGRLEFCHPLVRSAVYQRAAPSERRRAHAALAAALAGRDEERRAWHLAAAAVGEDAEAAARLNEIAEQSKRRGGYGAAAAAFERAARLGPPGPTRAFRLAAAADAALLSGHPERAAALAHEGLAAGPDRAARSALLSAKGRLAALGGDQRTAFDTFLEASSLAVGNPATELLTEAVQAGIQLGRDEVEQAAERLRSAAAPGDAATQLLVALALGSAESTAGSTTESVAMLARAVESVDNGSIPLVSARDLFWAGRAQFMLARNRRAVEFARQAIAAARDNGALWLLPQAQRLLAAAAYDDGDWRVAYGAAGDAIAVASDIGQRVTVCACLGILADIDAASGNEPSCDAHAREAIALASELGLAFYRERAERALGHLQLALGRNEQAAEQLQKVDARLRRAANFELNVTPAWDLIESYVRLGRINEARQTLNRAEREIPPVAPPELAVICRCRGLIDEHFEPQFEHALTLDMLPFDRARCELVYGERLRRAHQPRRAREHLRAAATIFGELGAHAWAERANTELRASGERRQSRDASREQLTPRETQIAIAVAEGASNRDVAAALFVTPKTVEYHLTRIYRKLGVRSRAELVKHYHR